MEVDNQLVVFWEEIMRTNGVIDFIEFSRDLIPLDLRDLSGVRVLVVLKNIVVHIEVIVEMVVSKQSIT